MAVFSGHCCSMQAKIGVKMKVSIIIPVYNPGKLLEKCLESAIHQTLEDIEIICINDGSTDDSIDILNKYQSQDTRIKVFNQENTGAGHARNVALEKANGEYIIFLDADDWIEKDMCETLYNQAQKLDCDMILFDVLRHLKNNVTKTLVHFPNFDENPNEFTFDYEYARNKVFNGIFGVIWCKFYRKSFIDENNIRFKNHKMFNDVEFHIKTMLLAESIGYCPKIFYHYVRIGQDTLQESFSSSESVMCFYDVMKGIERILNDLNMMGNFRMEYLDYACYYFKTKLNQIDNKHQEAFFEKVKSFLETLKATPEELKKLHNEHVTFYIHVLNSKNYVEYELIHNQFNGKNLNSNISQNYIYYTNDDDDSYNKSYINLLENCLNEKIDNINKLTHELNSKNNELSEKNKRIGEISKEHANLKTLNDTFNENNYHLKQENSRLINENAKLKKELDEIKSSTLWKLKNKL